MSIRYQKKIELGSYRVDRDLILDIEDYCNIQVPKLIKISTPLVDETFITLFSAKKHITFNSIRDYKNGSFQDIHAIEVDYSCYDDSRGIVVSTRFDTNGEDSYMQICLYDDREVVLLPQIQKELLKVISKHEVANRFTYTPESALVPFLVLALILGFFGVLLGGMQLKIISVIFIILDVTYIIAFRNIRGHCTFHLKTH
jgi:hypothetical protein